MNLKQVRTSSMSQEWNTVINDKPMIAHNTIDAVTDLSCNDGDVWTGQINIDLPIFCITNVNPMINKELSLDGRVEDDLPKLWSLV